MPSQPNPIDRPISPTSPTDDPVALVQYMLDMRRESFHARRLRMRQNELNRRAVKGMQDWSHKIEGQSREFIPKTSELREQFAAFIKRGLVQFGQWFSLEQTGPMPVDVRQVTKWLAKQLSSLPGSDGNDESIELKISDGSKVGLLESVIVLKVTAQRETAVRYAPVDDVEVESIIDSRRRLRIDLMRTEDYYPDPTGRGLYEIGDTEEDFSSIEELSQGDDPVYDPNIVMALRTDFEREEREFVERRKFERLQHVERAKPRHRVRLSEYWGTILDSNGGVAVGPVRLPDGRREVRPLRNVMFTVANDQFLIRRPEVNPYWHGESVFVKIPLLREPFTVWHRALFDQVVSLNFSLNEMFNLILDGGLAAVWGVRSVRKDFLENPRQVSGGVAQGATLIVNSNAPANAKVYDTVSTGKVPQDALSAYNIVDRELLQAAHTNDLKLGLLPPKQVKATEIVEASQNQAVTLDAIVTDMERGLAILIRRAYMVLMQYADEIDLIALSDIVGLRDAVTLTGMSPARRFRTMVEGCKVRVFGLSATLARARDFQRIVAIFQLVQSSPILLRAFLRKYSADKMLTHVFKLINLNPEQFERDEQEIEQLPTEMQEIMQLFGVLSQRPGTLAMQAQPGGEPGLPSEINQEGQPSET